MLRQNIARNLNQPASPLAGARGYNGQSPKTPTSPTIEQLLHSDARRWSASNVPTSPYLGRDHDPEEDHTHLHKKSVLAKVKEKARRWRQNLGKKKQNQDGNTTPSWGVNLDEDDDAGPHGDAEYLGAPIYESEKAPEELKETARQHPRNVPVMSDTLAFSSNICQDTSLQEKENPPNSPKQKASQDNMEQVTSPSNTLTESVAAKLAPAYETVTEKLAPAYATLSEKTHKIAAKFQSLSVSTPNEQEGSTAFNDQQTYDKGVSVKEYLSQKFEPGEDEKALSKAITEAISPKNSNDGKGVVEKVKDAVSSLLRAEESPTSKSATSTTLIEAPYTKTAALAPSRTTNVAPSTAATVNTIKPMATNTATPLNASRNAVPSTNKPISTKSAPNYSVSTYAYEAIEEESHGRVLQAN